MTETQADLTRPRILFIDDEPLAREAFALSLADRGFLVDLAESGDEALGLVNHYEYPVVATDWRMPRLDGIELVGRLRPTLPDASYLLVTGAPDELASEPERSSRVDGVIAKPWTTDALTAAIERAFQLHSKRTESRLMPTEEPETCRVLLVEDNPGDALLVTKQLDKVTRSEYDVVHVERLKDATALLKEETFQVALVDLSLPDAQGMETIRELISVSDHLPIVVLSGFNDEPLAIEAVQAGAQDYLVKGEAGPRLLHRAITYAIERKQVADRLQFLAHHDSLTGLANRALFRERVSRAISHARRTEEQVAVMFLDLDHFKAVNDSLGHDVGDLLLERVADFLLESVREIDTVARLGGDEFAILIEKLGEENDAPVVSQRILDALARPIELNGHAISISASIGISFFPDDGDSLGQLLKAADGAMYRAKQNGRNEYQLFSRETHSRVVKQFNLGNELRGAVARKEFEIHYQPQLDLRTGWVSGIEALLRWQHPEKGLIAPGQFIPMLEASGLIVDVGEWVLDQACRQVREWHADGFPDLRLSVNLSAKQLESGDLFAAVSRAMGDGDAGWLELEITESLLLKDAEQTVELLKKLKRRGVRISIDDFGTGFSSLSYLRRFPIDCLKIDRSFVVDIEEAPEGIRFATAIIALAHHLNLDVVAEGVETAKQLSVVRGCDGIQGFLYSRPKTAEDLTDWLRDLEVVDVSRLRGEGAPGAA